MPSAAVSLDVFTLVQEFTSSGERGLIDMVNHLYETTLLSSAEGDALRPESDSIPVDVFLESIGATLARLYDSLQEGGVVLEMTIGIYNEVLRLRPEGHERHAVSLINLGAALLRSFKEEHADIARLDDGISLLRRAVVGHPDRCISIHNLVKGLQIRFEQFDDLNALTEMIDLRRQALDLLPLGDPHRSSSLNNLANVLGIHFERLGDLDSLSQAINLHRQALDLRPLGHPDRSKSLDSLAYKLQTRFEQLGDLEALAQAVDLYRQALGLHPLGHPHRSASLNNLANTLLRQFGQSGDLDSLAEAVDLHRQALDLCPLGHLYRPTLLGNLASVLRTQFEELGDLDSLKEAADLHLQALDLRPLGHPDRSSSLNNLANVLRTQFEQFGDLDMLAQAIDLHRQALDLRPLGHPHHCGSLNNLANSLLRRFEHFGDLELLAEVIDLYHQVLDLCPLGHPDRPSSLNNLAFGLQTRFEQLGDLDALIQAIDLHRQALDLHPLGHPHRSSSLHNLADTLQRLFGQSGDLNLLVEAADLHRQALDLSPLGHPSRSNALNSLGNAYLSRFEQLGDLDSLTQAVDLYRQALNLCPLGHPDRSSSLSNLANVLRTQSEQFGDLDTLAQAVDLHRQALDLRPLRHPHHSKSLNDLANVLQARHELLGDLDALAEAIDLHRQALNLHPPGHPGRMNSLANLGTALAAHSSPEREMDEKLVLAREGLESCDDGHPMRLSFLISIAEYLLQQTTPVFDFAGGIGYILEGLQNKASPARQRLREAVRVLPNVEAAYQSITQDMSAVEIQQSDHDDMVLEVYIIIIRLLPRVASFGHDHNGRLRELSRAETVSRNAAARAIIMKREEEAVEMLEEGRGVFWAQALRLRETEIDLLPPQEGQELKKLFQLLETGGMRDDMLTSAQRERQAEQRHLHSEAADAIITKIRSRPGMERFLMPPAFASLVQFLPEGFMILLNVSKLGNHALIMNGSERSVSCITLKLPARVIGSKRKAVQIDLSRNAGIAEMDVSDDELLVTARPEEEPRASGVRERLIRTFEDSLADLWMFIVKPIIDVLQLKRSHGRDRPRVWWCATGNLTFHPIHAAGTYTQTASERSGTRNECVSDYMVSSYTPSILSLVRTRSNSGTLPRKEVKGLAVHEGSPLRGPDIPTLHKVKDEVDRVKRCFEAAEATITVVNDNTAHPTVSGVLASLQDSDVNILHLSCHGVQKRDPLASSFLLRDGDLTIQELMKLDLKHAFLTFLSACQTAKGSQDQPDQAVHLAASMLFCGFKSVIATMWSMADADGPIVAKSIYETLFKRETFDLNDVPYALDDAVRLLREQKVDTERWAVFMHIGA